MACARPLLRSTTSTASAYLWHNRWLAWQARERRQRQQESARIEIEKRRIFGEPDGSGDEDEELCVRMLDYFGGLDFIKG